MIRRQRVKMGDYQQLIYLDNLPNSSCFAMAFGYALSRQIIRTWRIRESQRILSQILETLDFLDFDVNFRQQPIMPVINFYRSLHQIRQVTRTQLETLDDVVQQFTDNQNLFNEFWESILQFILGQFQIRENLSQVVDYPPTKDILKNLANFYKISISVGNIFGMSVFKTNTDGLNLCLRFDSDVRKFVLVEHRLYIQFDQGRYRGQLDIYPFFNNRQANPSSQTNRTLNQKNNSVAVQPRQQNYAQNELNSRYSTQASNQSIPNLQDRATSQQIPQIQPYRLEIYHTESLKPVLQYLNSHFEDYDIAYDIRIISSLYIPMKRYLKDLFTEVEKFYLLFRFKCYICNLDRNDNMSLIQQSCGHTIHNDCHNTTGGRCYACQNNQNTNLDQRELLINWFNEYNDIYSSRQIVLSSRSLDILFRTAIQQNSFLQESLERLLQTLVQKMSPYDQQSFNPIAPQSVYVSQNLHGNYTSMGANQMAQFQVQQSPPNLQQAHRYTIQNPPMNSQLTQPASMIMQNAQFTQTGQVPSFLQNMQTNIEQRLPAQHNYISDPYIQQSAWPNQPIQQPSQYMNQAYVPQFQQIQPRNVEQGLPSQHNQISDYHLQHNTQSNQQPYTNIQPIPIAKHSQHTQHLSNLPPPINQQSQSLTQFTCSRCEQTIQQDQLVQCLQPCGKNFHRECLSLVYMTCSCNRRLA